MYEVGAPQCRFVDLVYATLFSNLDSYDVSIVRVCFYVFARHDRHRSGSRMTRHYWHVRRDRRGLVWCVASMSPEKLRCFEKNRFNFLEKNRFSFLQYFFCSPGRYHLTRGLQYADDTAVLRHARNMERCLDAEFCRALLLLPSMACRLC